MSHSFLSAEFRICVSSCTCCRSSHSGCLAVDNEVLQNLKKGEEIRESVGFADLVAGCSRTKREKVPFEERVGRAR